jgi:spore maturation protein CgeB
LERLLREVDLAVFCRRTEPGLGKTILQRFLYDVAAVLASCGVSKEFLAKVPLLRKGANRSLRPRFTWRDPIERASRNEVYGLDMLNTLASSASTLNVHIDDTGDYTGNIRLFEATGVGTCLLTDWKKDLGELFDIDREVVAFRSLDECLEKARWLLDHPQACEEIGKAGQRRTLEKHSYANRVEELDEIIRRAVM